MQNHRVTLRSFLVLIVLAFVAVPIGAFAAPTTTKAAQAKASTKMNQGNDAEAIKIAKRRPRRRRAVKARPKPPKAVEPERTAVDQAPISTSRGRPSRVEFDERLIRGQTNKADAIYLFERRSSEMRTLVKKRKHFHREIDETLN